MPNDRLPPAERSADGRTRDAEAYLVAPNPAPELFGDSLSGYAISPRSRQCPICPALFFVIAERKCCSAEAHVELLIALGPTGCVYDRADAPARAAARVGQGAL